MSVDSALQRSDLSSLESIPENICFISGSQTIFWDEPLKAFVYQRLIKSKHRGFMQLIQDADYFGRASQPTTSPDKFAILPHNDTTTKDLWSAAGEFSMLFGSETVISKKLLHHHGIADNFLKKQTPQQLDTLTEAWGWRGVVASSQQNTTIANVSTSEVLPYLRKAFSWALDSSEAMLDATKTNIKAQLLSLLDHTDNAKTLAKHYRITFNKMLHLADQQAEENFINVDLMSKQFLFSAESATKPRFHLLNIFLDPNTQQIAKQCYDDAVNKSQIRKLSQIRENALPFDVMTKDLGRGTLQLNEHNLTIDFATPFTIELKKPITNAVELAILLQQHLGDEISLIGKAITLIGMLASEFIWLFHESASSYLPLTQLFHENLRNQNIALKLYPIVWIRYATWQSLPKDEAKHFVLPAPFKQAFQQEKITYAEFSSRINQVINEQKSLLEKMANSHSPKQQLKILQSINPTQWDLVAEQYQSIQQQQMQPIAVEKNLHVAKKNLEHEIQMEFLNLVRNTLIVAHGLSYANLRPSIWWFPLVDSTGEWLRNTIHNAELYLGQL